MYLVSKDRQHHKVQLSLLNFATAASQATGAPGTGLAYIPVYYHLSASGVGSAVVYAGTGGSSLIRLKFPTAAQPMSGPWWDIEVSANKRLVLEVEGAVGVGQLAVWYIIVRKGAGSGGGDL